jgi:hypothetical protein
VYLKNSLKQKAKNPMKMSFKFEEPIIAHFTVMHPAQAARFEQ